MLENPTLLTALEALLNVLPPAAPSSKKKADSSLGGAANDFDALERLRKRAFAETVPPRQISEQMPVGLRGGLSDAAQEDNRE